MPPATTNPCGIRAIALCLVGSLQCVALAWGQAPPPMAEAMQRLSQGSQAFEQFVPGFVREISPENRRQLDAIKIDWKEEQKFGARILADYEQQLKASGKALVRKGADIDYLEKLVTLMKSHMRQSKRYPTIRLGIVPTDKPDAFSIPGGTLLFTSGLLETSGSEAALIGVIAHELSHLDRGHQLLPLKQQMLFARTKDWAKLMNAFAIAKPFHPEFEREADADALEWSMAAGYDPRELAHLLESWDQQQNNNTPWLDVIPTFVRSHPDAGSRAMTLLQKFAAVAQKNELYVGQQNLARRIPRDEQRF